MKSINVFATSIANEEPGRGGYRLALTDPDSISDKPITDRTFASGYAVPVKVNIPDDWTIAEANDGIEYIFRGDAPQQLAWYHNKGIMVAWPAFATLAEAVYRGAAYGLKSQKLSAVG